ncbi:MAG: prepilin-type N-terminal cleavage/methylation domain-containing protein [Patescibacteria group bacterium]|nr:prepilin-type N-terminal cleavage/methylation domain-containing protein [Patescibacteria group bacterium]
MKYKNKNRGFTLIELIVSLAMVAIVTGSVLQVARFTDTHKSLVLATDEVRAILRMAQSSALSIPNPQAKHICGYGVYISNVSQCELYYTYVAENDYKVDSNACISDVSYRSYVSAGADKKIVQTLTLADNLNFTLQVGKSVFFSVPYGEVFGDDGNLLSAGLTYTITNTGNGASRQISINEFGRMQ